MLEHPYILKSTLDFLNTYAPMWGAVTGTSALIIQGFQWLEAKKDKQAQLPNLRFKLSESKVGVVRTWRGKPKRRGFRGYDYWYYSYHLEITNIGGAVTITEIHNQNDAVAVSSRLPIIIGTAKSNTFHIGTSQNLQMPLKISVVDSSQKVWTVTHDCPSRPKTEENDKKNDFDYSML